MRLLQIALPGVDSDLIHPLIDAGRLPNIAQVIEAGTLVHFRSVQPLKHDVVQASFYCGTEPGAHGVTAAMAHSGRSWHAKDLERPAIWHILDQLKLPTVTVGCPATYGGRLDHGAQVPALFGAPGFLPCPALMKLCAPQSDLLPQLDDLWLAPEEAPDDIIRWILGGSDEAFEEVDEKRIGNLASHLAHTLSLHSVALAAMEKCSPTALIVSYPLIEALSSYIPQYCPPEQRIGDSDEEMIFTQVINRALQVLDQLVGALLATTSSDTTVCVASGYGYWTHQSRDTPLNTAAETVTMPWNRGWAALRGPMIKPDNLVSGERIYDVVPTLLAALRLPQAAHTRGKILTELLHSDDTFEHETIEFTLEKHYHFSDHPEPVSINDTIESLLAALDGYPSVLLESDNTQSQNDFEFRWQKILSKTESQSSAELESSLQELTSDHPHRIVAAIALVVTQLELGRSEEANEGALALLADYPELSLAHALAARCEFELGQTDLALQRLTNIEEMPFSSNWEELSVRSAMADIYSRAGYLSAGFVQLSRLVVLAPDSARAHRGLCDVSVRLGLLDNAEAALTTAMTLDSQSPDGYALKANLLMAKGEHEEAITALKGCLEIISPQNHVLEALIQTHKLLNHDPSTWKHYQAELDELPEIFNPNASSSPARLASNYVQPSQAGDDFDLQGFANWEEIPEVGLHFHVVTSQDPSDLIALHRIFNEANIRCVGVEQDLIYNDQLCQMITSPKALDKLAGHILVLPPRVLNALPDAHRYKVHWLKRETFNTDTLTQCSAFFSPEERLSNQQNARLLSLAQAKLLSDVNKAFHTQVTEYSALKDITKNVIAAQSNEAA